MELVSGLGQWVYESRFSVWLDIDSSHFLKGGELRIVSCLFVFSCFLEFLLSFLFNNEEKIVIFAPGKLKDLGSN